jgi:hypothetical protein
MRHNEAQETDTIGLSRVCFAKGVAVNAPRSAAQAIGTFRTRLTLEVDEPHSRAVGPRRVTQQYLPHQNEGFCRDSMGDAHSRGGSIALQSWWLKGRGRI